MYLIRRERESIFSMSCLKILCVYCHDISLSSNGSSRWTLLIQPLILALVHNHKNQYHQNHLILANTQVLQALVVLVLLFLLVLLILGFPHGPVDHGLPIIPLPPIVPVLPWKPIIPGTFIIGPAPGNPLSPWESDS